MACIFEEERKRVLNLATLYVIFYNTVQGNKHELRMIREFYSSLSGSFNTPCLNFPRLKMTHLNVLSLYNLSKLMFWK